MAKRIRIGDVVQVTTPRGFAYAHYSHKHAMFGSLLRILSGLYSEVPGDLVELTHKLPRFVTFFPLQAAVSRGIVDVVGNVPLPAAAQPFPLFRAAMRDPATGKVSAWWLWDGLREWRLDQLSAEQLSLPIREIVNDTLLVERIVSDWTPQRDAAS